jgi:hypothetical protein
VTPAEVADAVFSPLTRESPLPVGQGEYLYPNTHDDAFYVPALYVRSWYEQQATLDALAQDA